MDNALPMLTRFAPSPTGYLHLGHVVNAVYVWGMARAQNGRVLLRIEDHDRLRCRPAYERALLEDLAWLGFEPDLGPVRQNDTADAYAEALAGLASQHHVYACDCSRRMRAGPPHQPTRLADATGTRVDRGHREARYSGRCRTRHLLQGPTCGVRLELEPGVETFEDALLGPQEQDPSAQCGDLLLRDRNGHWTYQFAVTVDDNRQGVDVVIRGADLVESTARQIRLARMLGRDQPPSFVHHPLILQPSGLKLSKSLGDTGVRDLRAAGASPAAVIGLAVAGVGLAPPGALIEAADVRELFVGSSPVHR
jgi:glutamyl-tRNA synthetase/glutamyl-Q tRNA(Asp) synthetase